MLEKCKKLLTHYKDSLSESSVQKAPIDDYIIT